MQKFLGGLPLQTLLSSLQFKSFFRTGVKSKKVGTTILRIFMFLYILSSFVFMGFGLSKALEGKEIPPTKVLGIAIASVWVIDFLIRYLVQKSPSINSAAYLVLPIKKKVLSGHLIKKALSNPLNWMSTLTGIVVLFVLPYITTTQIICWSLAYISIPIINFCLGTLIKLVSKNNLAIDLTVIALCISYYFPFWSFFVETIPKTPVFIVLGRKLGAITDISAFILVALPLIAVVLYYIFRNALSKEFYLSKAKNKTYFNFSLNFNFEDKSLLATLVIQEFLLIFRNKRAKTLVLMGLAFSAFYGLILYQGVNGEEPQFFKVCFGALFVSCFGSISYGQLIPSWDSAQRAFFNVQPISYYNYIRSKYFTLVVLGLVSNIIAVYYGFVFGMEVVKLQLTLFAYHLGVNIPIILVFGLMNKKYVDINAKATMNYEGVNFYQFIMTAVALGVPMILLVTLKFYAGMNGALLITAGLGLTGIVFSRLIIKSLSKEYKVQKHDFLAVYGKK